MDRNNLSDGRCVGPFNTELARLGPYTSTSPHHHGRRNGEDQGQGQAWENLLAMCSTSSKLTRMYCLTERRQRGRELWSTASSTPPQRPPSRVYEAGAIPLR